MRRNIFDILEEEMNLEYEIETIVNLFNEARMGFCYISQKSEKNMPI